MNIADISLLSQDRLIIICMISTALMTLVISKQSHKWFRRRFAYHGTISLICGLIVWFMLQRFFEHDSIPLMLILWVGWMIFGISLLFTIRLRTKKVMAIAGTNTVFALTFSLLSVNLYYQYFPTIGSLFDTQSFKNALASSKPLFVQSHLATRPQAADEASYIPPADQPAAGKLEALTIPGDISHFTSRQEFVYFPPAALVKNPIIKLPVLILMAGVPGNPGDWIFREQLEENMNMFAAKHHGLAPIVVVADQTGGSGFIDTGCVDSPRGNLETYLTQDVPNYIKQHFQVELAAHAWAIGGFSDGATCSITLGFRHPEIFQTIISLSGESAPNLGSKQKTISTLFAGSGQAYNEHDARYRLKSKNVKAQLAHMAVWLTIGRDEQANLIQTNRDIQAEATSIGLDSTLEILPGHHSFGLWKRGFLDALPWVTYHQSLTTCHDKCN